MNHFLEFPAIAVTVHDKIQLDVIVPVTQTKTADGEIGTAENRILHSACGDVIHLSVKQV